MEYLKQASNVSKAGTAEFAKQVIDILADIEARGETAVREYSEQFDDWSPESFRVDDEEIAAAKDEISNDLKESIEFAQEQVSNFAQEQLGTLGNLEIESRSGVTLGHRHIPVASVGAYVPGGNYTLIASSYNSVIPAKVAGVERVVVCTPPAGGRVPPAVLYSAYLAGADEIYALGGIQAMAAMAHGSLSGLNPVDMLVGPGNPYVVEAKRQLFGLVGVDLLAGPTEIVILADETADPFIVACDLIGQAEHGSNSRAILVTTSREFGQAVVDQIDDHLRAVPTQEIARHCWENGGEVVVANDEEELISLSETYAAEHVEVMIREPQRMIERLKNYGSLFLGEEATVAYGDKVSGPNHILPTLRAARYTGGLWVGKYLKTVTYQRMSGENSAAMARHCKVISDAEGMAAHARTAAVRLERG